MPDLRFLANMHISPITVQSLRKSGWDIVRVSEVISAKARDMEVIRFAQKQNMIIITQDLDYTTLLAVNGFPKPSVISLRLENVNPEIVAKRLLEVIHEFEKELSSGIVISVDEDSARFRYLPLVVD